VCNRRWRDQKTAHEDRRGNREIGAGRDGVKVGRRNNAGDKLKDALAKIGTWSLEIIKRSDAAKGFVLLP